MKKLLIPIMTFIAIALLLMGCGDSDQNKNNTENNHGEDNQNHVEGNDGKSNNANEPGNTTGSEGSENDDTDSSDNQAENEKSDGLSDYSSEEIEYARVWLKLGENQNVDELNATQIKAGEPLNPDDETSLDYPEDVVQLSGSRLVDGTITYSSNGDGTINVYDIPQRWDGKNPAGEDVYEKLIDNTEQVSIDPDDDEKVIDLIEKLEIDS